MSTATCFLLVEVAGSSAAAISSPTTDGSASAA